MRIALGIEYDGTHFSGWQAQINLLTVQGEVERALSIIANEKIKIFCAGRTDAGVHATGQTIHFDTEVFREDRAWIMGCNANLPSSIAIKWIKKVDDTFHARFSALSRRYRYIIYNSSIRSALFSKKATWHHRELDAELMHDAAQCLVGKQDFSSFRSSDCEAKSPVRDIHYLTVHRQEQFVILEIQANAFLHHMVRNISGSLMDVGAGHETPAWLKNVLTARDRKQAGITAPAAGLYLCNADYPERFFLPNKLENKVFF
jgi:tRNA pseudouridine38-40 synthase